MRDFFKGWGTHVVALVIFLGLVITYFAPVELEGKVVRQGDTQKFVGMSRELTELPKERQEGVVAWLGSMFSGMPSYQVTVVNRPDVHLDVLNKLLSH